MAQKYKARVAYFCMEFGLDAQFQIYSGGLGILAGDILKAACDESLPMVGVGIRWRQGYGEQYIDKKGFPYDSFAEQSHPFLEDTGVEVEVEVRKRPITLKVWKCEAFGNVPLYLLDAYLSKNKDKLITGQLYGWFDEERLAQEIILGVGGVLALQKLGIEVDYYHFNDSHPVVAGLELIRQNMKKAMSFTDAWQTVREQIVFTTHTPIIHGNESYEHDILQYMGVYGKADEPDYNHLRLNYDQMVTIGGDPFSMTVAGLSLSKRANGVSQIHAKTAQKMWEGVEQSAPILGITNGVHNGTWQCAQILEKKNEKQALWLEHQNQKNGMIAEISSRCGVTLREDVLTIGFARRAASYKRSDLIFRQPEWIDTLLINNKVQLIFSGKAHPNDMDGKQILANLVKKTRKYPKSVVFVQNYDMAIGALLTRGCDIWLNNPIPPLEASGTSGMKAAMNGVLNMSTLDGWWPEGCEHGVTGWQIGSGYIGKDQDENDLQSLIKTLLDEVIPTYYEHRENWIRMMKNSIEMATEQFSAKRMVLEYYQNLYC